MVRSGLLMTNFANAGRCLNRRIARPLPSAISVSTPAPAARASLLYRSELWSAGVLAARWLPARALRRIGAQLALAYWRCHPARREIVMQNLLPACGGDLQDAGRLTRELFRNFSEKLIDLFAFEAGRSVGGLFHQWRNWEFFQRAQSSGRGALLITPHLGNWELGGPLMIERGVALRVITQAEPDAGLTRRRQRARARQGIESIVVGEDPFAFVEVIRQLEGGAAVALLVDRPPAATAAAVELFGRPFAASIAAAELARASGCALLPVCIARDAQGYTAQMFPEVEYDRAELGARAARQALTGRIMRVFEPVIRRYASQWYHFIPIWPEAARDP